MNLTAFNLKTITLLTLALSAFTSFNGCTKNNPTESVAPQTNVTQGAPNMTSTSDSEGLGKSTVTLKTNKGTMKIKFYDNDAPKTVARISELIKSGYYNGIRFHRVVPGFVVQGGDPQSKKSQGPEVGSGGSGTKLNAEFNSRKHLRGVVSMARTMDPNSADSQFYICLGTIPHLDGQYTVFGKVIDFGEKIEGKDVLERITQWDTIESMSIE